jgi:hypothetical protein
MGAPARIERARVGSKPTALPLSYGAVTEAAGLEPADDLRRLRASNALPYQLGHASLERKERESNPQDLATHPFSRRDTAPMAVLPRSGPGRARTCTSPGKSRELCRH